MRGRVRVCLLVVAGVIALVAGAVLERHERTPPLAAMDFIINVRVMIDDEGNVLAVWFEDELPSSLEEAITALVKEDRYPQQVTRGGSIPLWVTVPIRIRPVSGTELAFDRINAL